MLTFELFLIGIAFIWILMAVIFDLKSREIPDWLNFSLLIFAIFIRLFYSLFSKNGVYLLEGLFGLGIFFVLAHLLYYSKIFAGGDAKLLIALGAVIGFSTDLLTNLKYFVLFAILLIFLGAVYGLFYSSYLVFRNLRGFRSEFVKQIKNKKSLLFIGIVLFILGLIFILVTKSFYIIFFPLIFLIFPLLLYYSWAVEKACLIRRISVNKLREGDWLLKDVKLKINRKSRIIKSNFEGLSKKEINILKKYKKNVLIKEGIPFAPAFLIAFIIYIYLWYSNWSFFNLF